MGLFTLVYAGFILFKNFVLLIITGRIRVTSVPSYRESNKHVN